MKTHYLSLFMEEFMPGTYNDFDIAKSTHQILLMLAEQGNALETKKLIEFLKEKGFIGMQVDGVTMWLLKENTLL